MAILLASTITWTPPPRCPICGVGIIAYGLSEPFAVNRSGAVHCRRHGEQADATFPEALEAYLETTRSRVRDYLDGSPDEAPTPDDLARVDAELPR